MTLMKCVWALGAQAGGLKPLGGGDVHSHSYRHAQTHLRACTQSGSHSECAFRKRLHDCPKFA